MTQNLHIYRDLAKYYDAQYSWKDYGKEVRYLEAVARRFGPSGGAEWLDVACGTGKHLEHLRRRHRCVGVDASREMLRVARRRLPGIRLVRGDMRTFRLHREFDVVSCLFSAIGVLTTERDLERTFANLARHLKPGGVAIVEPWVAPNRFRAGKVHMRTYQDPKTTIVRCAFSLRQGNHSIIRYHYLIGETGRGIRYLTETDRGLMVEPRRLCELMRNAGLESHFLSRGFMAARGLLIGVKPRLERVFPPSRRPVP